MSKFKAFIKNVAPSVGLSLGGPLGGLVAGQLVKKLGVGDISEVEDMFNSNTEPVRLALIELDKEINESNKELKLAELDIIKSQTESSHWFVAAARPALMWILVFAVASQFVIFPYVSPWYEFPMLDVEQLFLLVASMAGSIGARSIDKAKGVARENLK